MIGVTSSSESQFTGSIIEYTHSLYMGYTYANFEFRFPIRPAGLLAGL